MNLKKMTTKLLAMSFLAFSFSAFSEGSKQITYKFDQDKTTVKWTGTKSLAGESLGSHYGNISLQSGHFLSEKGSDISGGEFVVDMSSMTVLDGDKKMQEKLRAHLLNSDFFEVETFKTSKLVIKDVKEISAKTKEVKKGTHIVTADLTIKGKTNEIKFPATVKFENNQLHAKANIAVDRLAYGIEYMSDGLLGKLASKAKNKVIDRNFSLDIAIVANRQTNKIAR